MKRKASVPRGLIFLLGVMLLSAAALAPAGRAADPINSIITAIDAKTGVVTAKEIATGRAFQFQVKDAALLKSLKVGQKISADLKAMRVTLPAARLGAKAVQLRILKAEPVGAFSATAKTKEFSALPVTLRIILAGSEGSPNPSGAALVKVSPAAARRRSVVQRACTSTTGNQPVPANAVVADADGGCTLRFPPGTVVTLSATTGQGSIPVPTGGGTYAAVPINAEFTAFEGCQSHPNFPGSKRHCQLKLPASGEAQVKALFSK